MFFPSQPGDAHQLLKNIWWATIPAMALLAFVPVFMGISVPVRLTTYLACVVMFRAVLETAITTKVCFFFTYSASQRREVRRCFTLMIF